MTTWRALKKAISDGSLAGRGLPIAVLVLGVLVAPYAAGKVAFLVHPGAAAFLGGFIAVLLFRLLSPAGR